MCRRVEQNRDIPCIAVADAAWITPFRFAPLGLAKMKRLSHIDSDGRAQMVDVSGKPLSKRRAVARGKIRLRRETLDLIARDKIAKGNVFVTARIAGIQAAKQTGQLIPLCHTLPLGQVNIDIVALKDGAEVQCTAQTIAQTGVEMEALVGVTVALLTIYDMCKAVDTDMRLSDVQLLEKTKNSAALVYNRERKKSGRS